VIAYALRRIVPAFGTMFLMALLVFLGVYAIGNPVDLLVDANADPEVRDQVIHNLGLDKPLPVQFLRFLSGALHGNLGNSFVNDVPALQLILARLPATLELTFAAMLFAVVIGVPAGLWAGLKPGSAAGRGIMAASILGFSLPVFWVGLMMILVFSVLLGWLPAGGRGEVSTLFGVAVSFTSLDGLRHILLPAFTLSLYNTALIARLTRSGTVEVMQQDYIRFARAKGLSQGRLIFVHVLRNILVPIVTVVGLQFGSLIAFAAVTETIFAWPGIGKLLIDSILHLDRPVVVAYLLIVVSIFIVINLVVDILYSLLDPRVRLSDGT
jgi:peptide/nickel transport system permease protein